MTSADDESYKHKYHTALDNCTQIEKEWQQHAELIKRSLSRVSIIAQEVAPSIVPAFTELREAMRAAADPTEIEDALANANRALDASGDLCQQRLTEIKQSLNDIVRVYKFISLPKHLSKSLKNLSKDIDACSDTLAQHELMTGMQTISEEIIESVRHGDILIAMPKASGSFLKQIIAGVDKPHIDKDLTLPLFLSEQLSSMLAHIGVNDAHMEQADQLLAQLERGLSLPELMPLIDAMSQLLAEVAREDNAKLDKVCDQFKNQIDESKLFFGELRAFIGKHDTESTNLNESVEKSITEIQKNIKQQPNAVQQIVNHQLGEIARTVATFQKTARELLDSTVSNLSVLSRQLEESDKTISKLQQHVAEKRFGLQKDALTKLPNRQAYDDYIKREIQRALRQGHDLSFIVTDIDHFKKINDNFGHDCGDRAIVGCATLLRDGLRECDFICRYGGEEFVIVLPDSKLIDAVGVAEKLREQVAKAPFSFQGDTVNITMSFGVTQLKDDDDQATLFKRADEALYAAKEGGRNQVVTN